MAAAAAALRVEEDRHDDARLADVVDLVAAWLPDVTPLAATARFARCSAHFRSYLVASAAAIFSRCFACSGDFRSEVRRHHHVALGFLVYEGHADDERYAWQPATDRVACWRCVDRLGFEARAWQLEARRRSFDEEVAAAVLDRLFASVAEG